MIVCSKCQRSLANSKFGPDAKKVSGKSSWCRDCKKEYQKSYARARRDDPDYRKKHNEISRQGRFRHYGILEEDYNQILELQGGGCAGCGRPPRPEKRLDIDHRHQPGESKREPWERAQMVRGLLCHLCNRVVGILRDNPETFRNLANYLENPPARPLIIERFNKILKYLEDYEARKVLVKSL